MQLPDLTNQGNLDADCLRVCPLSHLLRKCQLSQGESREAGANFCLPHKPNLSLPLGEMSRSDGEGWNQLAWLFKFALIRTCLRVALSVICFANASSPKGRAEKPVRIFCLTHKPNLSLPLGEMSRSDREGWNQLTWLFKFTLTRAFLFCAQNKNRASFDTLSLGGRWWIRTTEVVDNRFTVCPLWPLGKPPIFTCRNRGAGGRT